MRVVVFVRATKDSEGGRLPTKEELEAMGRFNEELVKAGIMKDGAGLHPSSRGTRVRFSGDKRVVTTGPFPVNEIIAGYWIWEVESMEEAIEWVKRCPNPMPGDSDIEIRKFYEAEDFAEAYTPELKAQEDRLRAELEKKK
ncbi:YciI family protein [Candidatus Sumerlaeota bacterium]|nr:YciI family protein [Candidatus Sumerlaeota bacterium]